jgi:enamine deaminase RidA (YjgF/YER057c/UK114 family)
VDQLTGPPEPVGVYEPFARSGDLVFVSAISSARDGAMITGKVGRDLSFEDGREAAKRAADNLLAVLERAGEVEAVLLIRGQVNATEDFAQVHKVIDAASERIIERLGESGRHARTAIGCATLPNNNAVTLEAIARVRA